MQPPKINNLTELNSYLASLERSILELEDQNTILQNKLAALEDTSKYAGNTPTLSLSASDVYHALDKLLPNSGLFSRNFVYRAFTIWGHMFVAQLIISLTLMACYFGIIGLLALDRYFLR